MCVFTMGCPVLVLCSLHMHGHEQEASLLMFCQLGVSMTLC